MPPQQVAQLEAQGMPPDQAYAAAYQGQAMPQGAPPGAYMDQPPPEQEGGMGVDPNQLIMELSQLLEGLPPGDPMAQQLAQILSKYI
jgi:hypothetical protein